MPTIPPVLTKSLSSPVYKSSKDQINSDSTISPSVITSANIAPTQPTSSSNGSSSDPSLTNSSSGAAFSLPIPSSVASLLDGPSLIGAPTTSAIASSASLSLESRIQAMFNISCVNPQNPKTPPPAVDSISPLTNSPQQQHQSKPSSLSPKIAANLMPTNPPVKIIQVSILIKIIIN